MLRLMVFFFETFLDVLLPIILWFALWLGSKAPARRIFAHYAVTLSSLLALSGLLILFSGSHVLPNGLIIPNESVRIVFVLLSSLVVAFLVLGVDDGLAAYETAYYRFRQMKKEFLAVLASVLLLSLLYISFDDLRVVIDFLSLVLLGPLFYFVGRRIREFPVQRSGSVPASTGRVAIILLFLLSLLLPYISTLLLPFPKGKLISIIERHETRLETVVSPETYTLLDKNVETNRIGETVPLLKLEGMKTLRSFIDRSDCCYNEAFYLFDVYLGVVSSLDSFSSGPPVTLPVTPKRMVEEFRSSLNELGRLKENAPGGVLVAYLQALQLEFETAGVSPPVAYGRPLSTLLLNFTDYLKEKERRRFDDLFSRESSKGLEATLCLSQLRCYRMLENYVVKRSRWSCEEALGLFHNLKADMGLCASLFDSDEREKIKRYLETLVSCGSEQAVYILEKEVAPLDTDPILLESRRKVIQRYCEVLGVNITKLVGSPKAP